KTFFSTRRPAPETGGQRPTARCALGRKSVWNIISSRPRSASETRRGVITRDGGEIGDAVPVGGMAVSSPSPRSCGERVGVRGSDLLEAGTPPPPPPPT